MDEDTTQAIKPILLKKERVADGYIVMRYFPYSVFKYVVHYMNEEGYTYSGSYLDTREGAELTFAERVERSNYGE